ncbi:hypothetical protein VP468E531_P0066 [Vibrio phage 468E53-1]|nr:hypothetical protein VP468E531_P0066 [Vibrio phage 468E53-1]CAH9016180.1 hypothetical protein VP177E371_P0065 [Vibrio phage 177E37-1]
MNWRGNKIPYSQDVLKQLFIIKTSYKDVCCGMVTRCKLVLI